MPRALNTIKGLGKTPKPPLDTAPTLIPHNDQARPTRGGQQGNLLLVLTPDCCSWGPKKALPEFLVWPLINLY